MRLCAHAGALQRRLNTVAMPLPIEARNGWTAQLIGLQGKTTLACKAAASGWKRPLNDPIPLPRGRQLVTLAPAASLRSGRRLRPPSQSGRRQTVPPPRGTEDNRKSRRCRGRSGDLFLQFGAGLADLRRHQRNVLNLKEDPLGLLAVARCGILHLLGHGERIAGHRLALLDALNQLRAHRLDVFRRSFVFADNGFRRQLADLRGPVAMLDIVRHRQGRHPHPWLPQTDMAWLADPRTASKPCLDFLLQISPADDSFYS